MGGSDYKEIFQILEEVTIRKYFKYGRKDYKEIFQKWE